LNKKASHASSFDDNCYTTYQFPLFLYC